MIGKQRSLEKKSSKKLKLTAKNIKFLEAKVKGVKTIEAYKLAGYKGGKDAAYQLNNYLKHEIGKAFEHEGFSRDNLWSQILNLLSLPCVDKHGNELKALTFDQKERLLRLFREELPDRPRAPSHITQFNVYRSDHKDERDRGRNVASNKVIDITPIDVDKSA